jgi:pimeloyl-ACP methyl ester carboxylesterase
MPKIKIDELEFYYERHGSDGPPLMLICGLGGHIGSWDLELVEALSSKTRLLLFDNRGSGRSDKPDIEYSIAMLADDAAAFLDAIDVDKAHILGASMGGMIAQEFAVRHPDKTTTLILCCTAPGGHNMIPPEPWVIQELGRVDGLTPEEIARKNWPLSFTQEFMDNNLDWLEEKMQRELPYSTPAFSFKRQMMAAMHHDSHDSLPKVECPTLVMTGTEDILIPPKNSDLIAAQIPGAVLKQYENVGHAFMSEDREAVVRDIFGQVLGNAS